MQFKLKGQGDKKDTISITKNGQLYTFDLFQNNKLLAPRSLAIIFLFDLTAKSSFDKAIKSYQQMRLILSTSQNAIFLIGNKADLDSNRRVQFRDASAIAQKNNMIYLEISALKPFGVSEFLKLLQQKIVIPITQAIDNKMQIPPLKPKKSVLNTISSASDCLQDSILNMVGYGKQSTLSTQRSTQKVDFESNLQTIQQEKSQQQISSNSSANEKAQSFQNIVNQIKDDEKVYQEQFQKSQFELQVMKKQNEYLIAAQSQREKDLADFLILINQKFSQIQKDGKINLNVIGVKDLLANIEQIKQWIKIIQKHIQDQNQILSLTSLTSSMMLENLYNLLQIIVSKDVLPFAVVNRDEEVIQQIVTTLISNLDILNGKKTADGYTKTNLFQIFLENYQLVRKIDFMNNNQYCQNTDNQITPQISGNANQPLNNAQIIQIQDPFQEPQINQPILNSSNEFQQSPINNVHNKNQQQELYQSPINYAPNKIQQQQSQLKTSPIQLQKQEQNSFKIIKFSLKNRNFVQYFKTPQREEEKLIENQVNSAAQISQRSLTPNYSSKLGYIQSPNQYKQKPQTSQIFSGIKEKQQYMIAQSPNQQSDKLRKSPQRQQTIQSPISQKLQQARQQLQYQQQTKEPKDIGSIEDSEDLALYYDFLKYLNYQHNIVQNLDILRYLDFRPILYIQCDKYNSYFEYAIQQRWWWDIQTKPTLQTLEKANLFWTDELNFDFYSYLTPLKLFQMQNEFKEELNDTLYLSHSTQDMRKLNGIKQEITLQNINEDLKIISMFSREDENDHDSQQSFLKQIDEIPHQKQNKKYHINNKKSVKLHNHFQALCEIQKQYILCQDSSNLYKTSTPPTFILTKENYKQQIFKLLQQYDTIQTNINEVQFNLTQQKDNKQNFVTNTWVIKTYDAKSDTNNHKIIYTKEDLNLIKTQILSSTKKDNQVIVQKYIDQPLLIRNRKFTLKSFILLTCYNGLIKGKIYLKQQTLYFNTSQTNKAYWYDDGIISTSSSNYQIHNLDDYIAHNTNDQKQFLSDNYGKYESYNKMTFSQYQQTYFQYQNYSFEEMIVQQMKVLIIGVVTIIQKNFQFKDLSIEFVKYKAKDILNDRMQFCFEIITLNFIVDKFFKVWLLSSNNKLKKGSYQNGFLYQFYNQLVDQTFKIAVDPFFPPPYYTKLQYDKIPKNIFQNNKFNLIYENSIQM